MELHLLCRISLFLWIIDKTFIYLSSCLKSNHNKVLIWSFQRTRRRVMHYNDIRFHFYYLITYYCVSFTRWRLRLELWLLNFFFSQYPLDTRENLDWCVIHVHHPGVLLYDSGIFDFRDSQELIPFVVETSTREGDRDAYVRDTELNHWLRALWIWVHQ